MATPAPSQLEPNPLAATTASAPHLRIGEVAKRTGVSVKTIRFYCDQGLLQPSGRSEGGFRLFDASVLADLAIIRALRTMDVPIAELARILDMRRSGVCNCSTLRAGIADKVESIDQRIAELAAMKQELSSLLERWQDCGGAKTTG